jgi:hypothetical protein
VVFGAAYPFPPYALAGAYGSYDSMRICDPSHSRLTPITSFS